MPEVDHDKSQLGFMPMLRITWGTTDPQVRRYVRSDQDLRLWDAVTGQGEIWTAMPEMDIEYDAQDGGTQAKPVRVTMPVTTDPIDKMIAATFAPTEISILEGDFTDISAMPRPAFLGQIAVTKARFRGKSQLVQVELQGRKLFMKDVSLGVKATDRCPWFFGDDTCGFNLVAEPCTVISIFGTTMVVSGLSQSGTEPYGGVPGIYTRGFAEFNGLRIMIRQQTRQSPTTTLIMAKAPPQTSLFTWVGLSITCSRGCDKTVAACVFYGQELRFGGIGLLMPKYDPLTQNRPEGGGPDR